MPGMAAALCFPFAMLGLLGGYANLSLSADALASYPVLAHWVARLVSAVVYIALLATAVCGRTPLRSRVFIGACGALLCAGVLVTLYGAGSVASYVVGQVLVGLANPVVLVAWGLYLASLPSPARRGAIVLAAIINAFVVLAFRLANPAVARVLYLVIVLGSFVPLVACDREPMPLPFRATTPAGLGGTTASDNASAIGTAELRARLRMLAHAVPWELVVLMGCYALLFRTLQTFDYGIAVLTPVVRAGVTCAAMCALGAYLLSPRAQDPRCLVIPLFVLAGSALVLIPLSNTVLRAIASAVANSCWSLFYYLLWIVLLDLGSDNDVGAPLTFLAGWTMLNVELVAAAPLASALSQQVERGLLSTVALILVLVYTLLVASLLFRRKRESTTCRQAAPDTGDMRDVAGSVRLGIDEMCAAVGAGHGLTQREHDVLKLLARGRSVPFIANELGISASTAKGHVRHIYVKLGVSNKQELLTKLSAGDRE